MDQQHNPMRQVDYIRQGLANDRLPLGFFLGAGCPLSVRVGESGSDRPLIPDILGLTKFICDSMEESDEECKRTLKNIQDQLIEDGTANPNIEAILSRIRALHAVAGNSTVRGLNASELDALDTAICEIIVEEMAKILDTMDTPYHKLAIWIGSVYRTLPVRLFTLNYDLILEQALEDYKVPYFDGFVGSCNAFFDIHAMEDDVLPPRWARLWKLHGSINWRLSDSGIVSRSELKDSSQRYVIYPSHLKYEESRRMPYLAMIDQLRAFLKEPSALLITCGYSFGDDHLNEVIVQGLQGNPSVNTIALMHGPIDQYTNAIKLANSCVNLSVLAEDQAVIGTRMAPWICRQKEDAEAASKIGVSWLPLREGDSDSPLQACFKLGDFSVLGEFIEDIVGTFHMSMGDTDAQ